MASPVVGTGCSWANLPEEIVQVLGTYLDAQCWAAARTTCKGWRNITANVNILEIDLERDAHRWMMVLTCVTRLFPRLSSIALLIGSRITAKIFTERMQSLAITNTRLQELELRFIYLTNPTIGDWLVDMSAVTELRRLKALAIAGGATPPVEFFMRLSQLRQLTALVVLPGADGQLFQNLVGNLASANSQAVIGGDRGLCDSHLAAVAALTQLKTLIAKVSPSDCTPRGLLSLTDNSFLARLEHLDLYDSEFPSDCLATSLREAGCLTALQLGLNDVDDLAPLALMPKLKNICLDTAYLPDLRELVYAAARGNIPQTGSGSITGLCLMDQVISSPLQLAALSQLSSLSELIMINPLPDRITDHDDQEDQDDIPDLAGQQQQQQQPVVIDLACLSGLTALSFLQIDLRLDPSDQLVALPWLSPLQLLFSAAAVQQLAAAWTSLVTLDLSGFTPELLPEAAVLGFSNLCALKNLSLMILKDAVVQDVGTAAAANQQQQQQQRWVRKLGWWQTPANLLSLCLSHFDLSFGVLASSDIGSSSPAAAAAAAVAAFKAQSSKQATAVGTSGEQLIASLRDSSSCSSTSKYIPSACGSSSCCLASSSGTHPLNQQQQQQQQVPGSGLGRVQSLLSPRISPLRALGGTKRRRESPESVDPMVSPAAASGGGGSSSTSTSGSSGEDSTVATVRGGYSPDVLGICPCAARVVSHFSSLQSLWLEHCTLPRNFLPLVLPALQSTLEALALIQVSGTRPDDLKPVSGLTSLTSLRLIPSGHGLTGMSGLSGLLPLRHLKRLSLRLSHLRQKDLAVLPELCSLFCISLVIPAVETPRLVQNPVALHQVVDVVRESLPYCDVELQK